MVAQSHPRLRAALKRIGQKNSSIYLPKIIQVIVWELMRTQTRLTLLEKKMAHKKKPHVKSKEMPMPMKAKKELPKLKGSQKKGKK